MGRVEKDAAAFRRFALLSATSELGSPAETKNERINSQLPKGTNRLTRLGQLIQRMQDIRRYSNYDLARETDTSEGYIRGLKYGPPKQRPDIEKMEAVRRALSIRMDLWQAAIKEDKAVRSSPLDAGLIPFEQYIRARYGDSRKAHMLLDAFDMIDKYQPDDLSEEGAYQKQAGREDTSD